MNIQFIACVAAVILTIIASALPSKHKDISNGLFVIALTIVLAGIIVAVLL